MSNTNTNNPFANLFEQAANISKAAAYDIVAKQRDELLAENDKLKKEITSLNERLDPKTGHYNDAPEHLREISLEDWQHGMFMYCIEPVESRQVSNREKNVYFNLRMWGVPNFENKPLGYAIMYDWFDTETGKNRHKPIIRFCIYGSVEDWTKFTNRFCAQFAGDNS